MPLISWEVQSNNIQHTMTVSGAPETAPIEQRFCQVLPPAIEGNNVAIYVIVYIGLGIAPPRAAVRPLPCCFTIPRLNYITPT